MSNETEMRPFLGFTYDGVHSSNFNIVRVNTGSRFEENLLPSIVDKALEIPGRDGKILQGTQYGPQNRKIDFAFDNMSEADIKALKALFAKKKIAKLIYDEYPERVWYAKPTGTNIFKYIPFEGPTKAREDDIYKGEGTINFICYDPFAHEAKEPTPTKSGNSFVFSCENNGLEETPFQLQFPAGQFATCSVYLGETEKLRFNNITKKSGDVSISINSRNGLTEGLTGAGAKTGQIYDEFIVAGNYFNIPVGESTITVNFTSTAPNSCTLKFDALYL